MAQFIQDVPQVRNAGIGSQQVIADQSPNAGEFISRATQNFGNALETAGNIYSQNKAKELVNESLGDVEEAIGFAQQTSGDVIEPGTGRKQEPTDLNVSDDEFNIIQSAVANGDMTRDKARLLASSRLRSRIAEQPLMERQLRRAASNIIGFNIESEQARQYFAAFPAQGQGQGGGNSYREGLMEKAQVWAEQLDIPVEAAMQNLAQVDAAETRQKMADIQSEAGAMQVADWASETQAADADRAFKGILSELKIAQKEGEQIDSVVVNNAIKARRESFLTELRTKYDKKGGVIGSEDFNRIVQNTKDRYAGYEDLIESVGFDNLDQVRIDRAERTREMVGDEMFPKMKTLSQNLGQQVASDVFNLLSSTSNETQLKLMLERNPGLKEAYEFLNKDTKSLNQQLFGVVQKVLNGEETTEQEQPLVDFVAQKAHQDGGEDTKTSVIQGLAAMGGRFKGLSLMANTRPGQESASNIETYKRMYNQDLPVMLDRIGSKIGSLPPEVSFVVNEDGEFELDVPQAEVMQSANIGFRMDPSTRGTIGELREDIDRLNTFAKGHKKGWSNVVGESLEEYRIKVNQKVQQGIDKGAQQQMNEQQENFLTAVRDYDMDAARSAYDNLKQRNPSGYTKDFNALVQEARRRMNLPAEGDDFVRSMEAREGGQ